nr:immunoglobulin-like domain-containing protein [uncultured Oscillibacter sp.]
MRGFPQRTWKAPLCLLLAAAGMYLTAEEWFQTEKNSDAGVIMTVVEETAGPGGVTVEVVNGTPWNAIGGNARSFSLERETDGAWRSVEPLSDTFLNTTEGVCYQPGTTSVTFQWNGRYGPLTKGHYRVVKWFSVWEPGKPADVRAVAEFTII